jgi:hypothetical protein
MRKRNNPPHLVFFRAKEDGVATYTEDGRRRFVMFDLTHEERQLLNKKFPNTKKPTMRYEDDKFNQKQLTAYKIAVYGLGSLPKNILREMGSIQLENAKRTFVNAQIEINRLKHERTEAIVGRIMNHIPRCRVTGFLGSCRDEYDQVKNTLSFSQLRIDRGMIVKRLVEKGILDGNLFKKHLHG